MRRKRLPIYFPLRWVNTDSGLHSSRNENIGHLSFCFPLRTHGRARGPCVHTPNSFIATTKRIPTRWYVKSLFGLMLPCQFYFTVSWRTNGFLLAGDCCGVRGTWWWCFSFVFLRVDAFPNSNCELWNWSWKHFLQLNLSNTTIMQTTINVFIYIYSFVT